MTEQLPLSVDPPAPLARLREALGAEWPHLTAARERAAAEVERLYRVVWHLVPPDTTLVVFGSLARGEFTDGSDVDWTLLVDGMADPLHQSTARRIEGRLREIGHRPPAAAGPFGSLTFSHDLIHNIGGDDDTNRNTTQRLLLLLESMPVGEASAYDRVVYNVLDRYIGEDLVGPGDTPYRVPRFLQNDVVRYWRTMAVDFAHKRRVRGASGWALRTAKLRMSRKLMYAAGLVSCFSCELDFPPERRQAQLYGGEEVVRHLAELVRMKPLDILARVVLAFGEFSELGRELFGAYDEFLALLGDSGVRGHLQTLAPSFADADPVYQRVRDIGARFQDALTGIFLDADTPLRELTRRYGVF